MISISLLAILVLETDSFALLGQLCILYVPPPSASDHTRIWSEGQHSQHKFFPDLCWNAGRREEGLFGGELSISDLLSTHSMHTDLRAPPSNKAENNHLFMQVSDQGALWVF